MASPKRRISASNGGVAAYRLDQVIVEGVAELKAVCLASQGMQDAFMSADSRNARCRYVLHPPGKRQKASSARSIRSVSTFSTTARVAEIAGRMVLAKNEAAASLPR